MDITKQQLLADTFIVGIDPAKKKHQAVVLTPEGLQQGNPFASMFRTRAIRSSSGRNYHFLYLIAIPRTLFLFLRRPAISGQRSRSFFFPCPQPEAFYKHTRQRVSTSYKGKSLPLHEEIENIILNHIPPITKDAFSKRMSGEQTWILNQQH